MSDESMTPEEQAQFDEAEQQGEQIAELLTRFVDDSVSKGIHPRALGNALLMAAANVGIVVMKHRKTANWLRDVADVIERDGRPVSIN